jgi:hypothetical protein
MDVGEGIAGETAIKLMHKEIGIFCSRYRVQTRKFVFMDKIHLLRVGWRNFFSSCAVVSVFWFLEGNRFWCYLLTYLEYNTVVVLC